MGFWYRNASIGPNSLCETSSGTPPEVRQTRPAPTARRLDQPERDRRATAVRPHRRAVQLQDGSGRAVLERRPRLTINGSIFIDGSATSYGERRDLRRPRRAHPLRHVQHGQPRQALREADQGGGLRHRLRLGSERERHVHLRRRRLRDRALTQAALGRQRDRDQEGRSSRAGSSPPRTSTRPSRGTVVQGPMVSAYGDVATGQGGELSFPAISFPTSGSAGSPARCPCPSCSPRACSAAAEMHPNHSSRPTRLPKGIT